VPIDFDTFEAGFFDVVTAFEVFEHVTAPNREARLVGHALRPGGLLYCTTPNFDSLSRRLLGPRWNVIEYPEHLCYFNPAALKSWLSRFGFDGSVRTSGMSIARLRSANLSSPASKPAAVGPGDEALREAIERSPALRISKNLANACLGAIGGGDTLKARFELTR
jgi:SAM-dependent methyltransferase